MALTESGRPSRKATVCLVMIVKDEAHVIRRSLGSVKHLIDTWVIVDTGSTDDTMDIIREELAGIPGELHQRPWKNFGHNRSEALAIARDKADYSFTIDADEMFTAPPGWTWPDLQHGLYGVTFVVGGAVAFTRPALMENRLKWRYEGVLHEFPAADGEFTRSHLEEPRVIVRHDGGRSQVSNDVKYAADAKILEDALLEEPNNSRYVFYLAQSYRDCNQLEKALENYLKRAKMGGFPEEVFYSLHQAALLSERLNLDEATIVKRYLDAYENRPRRIEPLVALARYYRTHGDRFVLGHMFAHRAAYTPRPDDILFVDESSYTWRAWDEYAIAAYWLGQYEVSLEACERILAAPQLPDDQRDRIMKNRNFSREKLDALAKAAAV